MWAWQQCCALTAAAAGSGPLVPDPRLSSGADSCGGAPRHSPSFPLSLAQGGAQGSGGALEPAAARLVPLSTARPQVAAAPRTPALRRRGCAVRRRGCRWQTCSGGQRRRTDLGTAVDWARISSHGGARPALQRQTPRQAPPRTPLAPLAMWHPCLLRCRSSSRRGDGWERAQNRAMGAQCRPWTPEPSTAPTPALGHTRFAAGAVLSAGLGPSCPTCTTSPSFARSRGPPAMTSGRSRKVTVAARTRARGDAA